MINGSMKLYEIIVRGRRLLNNNNLLSNVYQNITLFSVLFPTPLDTGLNTIRIAVVQRSGWADICSLLRSGNIAFKFKLRYSDKLWRYGLNWAHNYMRSWEQHRIIQSSIIKPILLVTYTCLADVTAGVAKCLFLAPKWGVKCLAQGHNSSRWHQKFLCQHPSGPVLPCKLTSSLLVNIMMYFNMWIIKTICI
jgi:hypothetical protein